MWPGGRGGRAEFIQGCMGMVASCSLSEMACGEMEMVIAWSLITRVGEIRGGDSPIRDWGLGIAKAIWAQGACGGRRS